MAKVTVTKSTIEIELGFWERLGSFSKNSSIILSDISNVEAVKKVTFDIFGFRLVGTGLPGVAVLGHYRKSKKRMMVYWVRGQQAVVVDLKKGPYQRMVIGCVDATALAKKLTTGV